MTQFSARAMMRHRDCIVRAMEMLTDERLAEIERRSEQDSDPDGFGSGTSPIHSSDVADPTGSTVAQLIDEPRHFSDPQMVAFVIIERNLRVMAKASHRVMPAWRRVDQVTEQQRRRSRASSLGICQACLRSDVAGTGSDRIVNGYCPKCRMAWVRAGHPDRLLFEIARRKQLAEVLDD